MVMGTHLEYLYMLFVANECFIQMNPIQRTFTPWILLKNILY